jgi:hypothetical protein
MRGKDLCVNGETLGVFSKYAKRCKSVNISENNNTNKNFFEILTNYTIWDGLSQKTISRYCPFKRFTNTGSAVRIWDRFVKLLNSKLPDMSLCN